MYHPWDDCILCHQVIHTNVEYHGVNKRLSSEELKCFTVQKCKIFKRTKLSSLIAKHIPKSETDLRSNSTYGKNSESSPR